MVPGLSRAAPALRLTDGENGPNVDEVASFTPGNVAAGGCAGKEQVWESNAMPPPWPEAWAPPLRSRSLLCSGARAEQQEGGSGESLAAGFSSWAGIAPSPPVRHPGAAGDWPGAGGPSPRRGAITSGTGSCGYWNVL